MHSGALQGQECECYLKKTADQNSNDENRVVGHSLKSGHALVQRSLPYKYLGSSCDSKNEEALRIVKLN